MRRKEDVMLSKMHMACPVMIGVSYENAAKAVTRLLFLLPMPERVAQLGLGVIKKGSEADMNEDIPKSVMCGYLCAMRTSS